MNESAIASRPIFETLSPAMVATFYVVAIAALGVFGYGVWQRIVKYRKGKKGLTPLWSWSRILSVIKVMAAHSTLRKMNPVVGMAHGLMFWGFATLFTGTVLITIDQDILKYLLPSLQFWSGEFYLYFSLVLDVMGLAVLLGLIFMATRRWIVRPARLNYARPDRTESENNRDGYRQDDRVLLWGLIIIIATGFVVEAVRIGMAWSDFEKWSVVGWHLGTTFEFFGMTPQVARTWHPYLWWGHALLALSFIAYLPYSKAIHMLLALASLYARDSLTGKRLPKADAESHQMGYATMTDFSAKELLTLDACTRCGRCHEACPARAGGWPLSPRDVVLELRENAETTFGTNTLLRAKPIEISSKGVSGTGIHPETLWSCTTCLACVDICPVGVEHVPMIVQMRRHLVERGEMDTNIQATLERFMRFGNSFGSPEEDRGNWTEALEIKVPDARKEAVDVLWFVGDYASFHPDVRKATQKTARIFQAAGLKFGILYDGERNAGNDVRRVGEEGLYEFLVEHNIQTLSSVNYQYIVTTDPHTLNTLKNEYPDLKGQVYHFTEVIADLLDKGDLPIKQKLSGRVTYHDPCHLSRYNNIITAPRRIIQSLGLELVEMPRNGTNSFCCGAGGGRIWMANDPSKERPSENRVKEALSLGTVTEMVTNCPKCFSMMQEAITATGAKDKLAALDLIDYIEQAVL
jgi:Fe-S oxidoreductase/nitrate reductase gamma subunit